MLKIAEVLFENSKYNYTTSVNGQLSDEEIKTYFEGKTFNLGNGDKDDLQKCIKCNVLQ